MIRRALAKLLFRAYQAAQPSKQHPYPIGAGQSGDANVYQAFPKLGEWGRHLDDNHSLTVGILSDLVEGTVGKGIAIEPMVRRPGSPDELWDEVNDTLRDGWALWSREVDVTRALDWGRLCQTAARSWYRDGECFAQHVSDNFRFTAIEVPYRVEFLEAEMCPTDLVDEGRAIKMGVQLNEWNAPVGYWIYRRHPNDIVGSSMVVTLADLKRVAADLIVHLKFGRRYPMTRGVSVMAAAIRTLEDLRDYEESERIAARVNATLALSINRATDTPGFDDLGEDATERQFSVGAGMVMDNLLPGESLNAWTPGRPNPEMLPFRNALLKAACASTGATYSNVARDYEGSYSSMRQELVQARQRYEAMTEQFIAGWARPIYTRWVEIARLSGRLRLPAGLTLDELSRAEYAGPAMPWVDPLKEIQADALAVTEGFMSREQVQRKRNPDGHMTAEQVERERRPAVAAVPDAEDEEDEAA